MDCRLKPGNDGRRPRAHRAVGRVPPVSWAGQRYIITVSCESGRKIGADPAAVNHGVFGGPPEWSISIVRPKCRAITMAPSPIISTASGFSIPSACRREAGVISSDGTSIGTGAPPRPSGRPGRRRLMPTGRRHASTARLGAFPASAMPAGSFRLRASTCCSTRYGRSARRLFVSLGRNESTIQALPLQTCRRSMSCWCHTPTMIISISPRCRGSQLRIAHASSRRSAMTSSCEITIRRLRPKPTTGRIW